MRANITLPERLILQDEMKFAVSISRYTGGVCANTTRMDWTVKSVMTSIMTCPGDQLRAVTLTPARVIINNHNKYCSCSAYRHRFPMPQLTLSSFSQNATVTVTQISVILTWRCIWLRGTSVEECVTTVSTTPWAATVRPVNLFTIRIHLETSETHLHVSVSCLW